MFFCSSKTFMFYEIVLGRVCPVFTIRHQYHNLSVSTDQNIEYLNSYTIIIRICSDWIVVKGVKCDCPIGKALVEDKGEWHWHALLSLLDKKYRASCESKYVVQSKMEGNWGQKTIRPKKSDKNFMCFKRMVLFEGGCEKQEWKWRFQKIYDFFETFLYMKPFQNYYL